MVDFLGVGSYPSSVFEFDRFTWDNTLSRGEDFDKELPDRYEFKGLGDFLGDGTSDALGLSIIVFGA